MSSLIQIILSLAIVVVLAMALGKYIYKVMEGKKTFLSKILTPCENAIYKVMRIDKDEQMNWKQYTVSLLIFSLIGFVFLFALLMLQGVLPLNPQGFQSLNWDLAFNIASSFVSNTNWQSCGGETTLSYLSQNLGLTVQNFMSCSCGIAVLYALIRAIRQEKNGMLGNFWVDITRSIVHILLPLNIVIALVLVSQGVVQNYKPYQKVLLLEPIALDQNGQVIEDCHIDVENKTVTVDGEIVEYAIIVTQQAVPMGPAASQVAIKQTGTNGGGFFNTNSAFPLENPNALTNLIEVTSIILIPAALCFSFGYSIDNKKQGRSLFITMFICLVVALGCIYFSEQYGNTYLNNEAVDLTMINQAGGNMEGKESRFGIASSSIWATYTTAASNGSVNSMHDSFTSLSAIVMMLLMQIGEVVFGGVGSGLYGMLGFCILTVFIAGLMVGRTPEFLSKKIEPHAMKWAVVVCLATPIAILVGSAIASLLPSTINSLNNGSCHGFSELLYAYSSAGANNGSAFAGFNGNTVFLHVSLGLVMLFARYVPMVATMAIASSLAVKKKVATSSATLSTTNGMFIFLLIFIILIIGALSFLPALALGPIAELVK